MRQQKERFTFTMIHRVATTYDILQLAGLSLKHVHLVYQE